MGERKFEEAADSANLTAAGENGVGLVIGLATTCYARDRGGGRLGGLEHAH